jgi:hypothetical protein
MFYWPVDNSPGNPASTIKSNYTGIRTAVVDGITMTSPSVYLKYHELKAATVSGNCSHVPDTTFIDQVFSVAPELLTSLGRRGFQSFNLVDLQITPIPTEIYFQQPRCLQTRM